MKTITPPEAQDVSGGDIPGIDPAQYSPPQPLPIDINYPADEPFVPLEYPILEVK